MAVVLWFFESALRQGGRLCLRLGAHGGVLEHANVAIESDGKMCDAHGFDDGEDDRAAHMVARAVLAMRFVGSYMKVGDVAVSRPQRQRETQARQKSGPAGRRRRRRTSPGR